MLSSDNLQDENLLSLLAHISKVAEITRCSLDGFQAVNFSTASYSALFSALGQCLNLRELCVSSFFLDRSLVQPLASLICSLPGLVDIAFEKTSLVDYSMLSLIADAVSRNSSLRKFSFSSKDAFSKHESKQIFSIFQRSFSLLHLVLPSAFDRFSDDLTMMLAQNQKIGLHFENRPISSIILKNRLFFSLPRNFCALFHENVTILDLSFNNLRGLPPSLSDFSKLEILNVSNNQIMEFPMFLNALISQRLNTVIWTNNPILKELPNSVNCENLESMIQYFNYVNSAERILCSQVRVAVLVGEEREKKEREREEEEEEEEE